MKSRKLLAGLILFGLAGLSARADGILTTLISFTYTNSPNYGWNFDVGAQGNHALILGDDGNLYGTTGAGGANFSYSDVGYGTFFQITPSGTFTSLYSFGSLPFPNYYYGFYDGTQPVGHLEKGLDGKFFGVTYAWGASGGGTVFSISTNGQLATLFSFGDTASVNNQGTAWVNYSGRFPNAGLVQSQDGNFYGTTTAEGGNGLGTIFKLTASGAFSVLHDFTPGAYFDEAVPNLDDSYPSAELVDGNDGYLYGTTSGGGVYGYGTVFRISATGDFTTLFSFNGKNGDGPLGIVLGKDGCFYGTTIEGGSGWPGSTSGTIYRITTNGALTTLYTFTGGSDGNNPNSLMQASDGNFYGTTWSGGDYYDHQYYYYGHGTIFQLTPQGKLTTLYAFRGPDGQNPDATLTEGRNGKLYGTTPFGGSRFIPYDSPSRSHPWEDEGYGTTFSLNIPPTILGLTATNGAIAISWNALSNQVCQVQYNTDLGSTNWVNLGSPITVTNALNTTIDVDAATQRYYRIQLLP